MASVLVIPAYNPDKSLLQLIKDHQQLMPYQTVIVVNDGSKIECNSIFDQLQRSSHIVLNHKTNMGKGAALKTAIRYYLNRFRENHYGIITADADGQHHIDDIANINQAFKKEPKKLHLGTRNFSENGIPLRSRFGNILTKFIINCFFTPPIQDTQSGLRAIPNHLLAELLECKKDRYEFEFEMFFIAKNLKIVINQIPIKTIYMNNNKSSHFRPLIDSMRIYAIFFRYGATATASFILDFTLFCLFYNLSENLPFSVLGARFCSSTFNFFTNKTLTFKSQRSNVSSATKYVLVAAFSGLMVWQITSILHLWGLNLYFSKISADFIFFCANFLLQRYWVFHDRRYAPSND